MYNEKYIHKIPVEFYFSAVSTDSNIFITVTRQELKDINISEEAINIQKYLYRKTTRILL
jgi:hypothetical protein